MWPRTGTTAGTTLLSILLLGAVVGGLMQWQLLRLLAVDGQSVRWMQHATPAAGSGGSVVIGKTDDAWYAPLLRRAVERQFFRLRRQPCVVGVCQDI